MCFNFGLIKTSIKKVPCFAERCEPELCSHCSRSLVEVSVLRSWTCLHAAFVGLNYFNFGLICGEFGGPLPPVEDLHQNILCLICCKVWTWTLLAMK